MFETGLFVGCILVLVTFLCLLGSMLTENHRRLKRLLGIAVVSRAEHKALQLDHVWIDGALHLIPHPEAFYLHLSGCDGFGRPLEAVLQVSKETYTSEPKAVFMQDGKVLSYDY